MIEQFLFTEWNWYGNVENVIMMINKCRWCL